MRTFAWNAAKDAKLRAERGVGFMEIALEIAEGNVLDEIEHPSPNRFPGQRIFVVRHGNYAYLVPYVEDEQWTFLKTIIPSRRETRRFLEEHEGQA